MKQAVWNGAVIAEADRTVSLEGNDYFPANSLRREYFRDSSKTSRCPWKGTANYYSASTAPPARPDRADGGELLHG